MTLRRFRRHGRVLARYDLDAVATRLRESVVSVRPYFSVAEAAKAENMTRLTFRRHLPAEYALVRDSAKKMRDASAAEHREKTCDLIRGFIKDLISDGVAPSNRKIQGKFLKAGLGFGIWESILYREVWGAWNSESLRCDRFTVKR
ncbi:hypothetical protein AB4Y45_25120 [Paraburkholderia sp. EG287A]|uniref:hypothetical protein n=1 Tax=unclassified Paraburkholderia TaxID=2615204 RepID=UPI0034D371E2